jgi:hypothetical protein
MAVKQIVSHKRRQLMMCKNQHGRLTSNFSDGRPERIKRVKQQGSTSGVPTKAPPMPLSVVCRE